MSVIAITGVSGCLGSHLLTQMDVDEDVERVVGIDLAAPPAPASPKLAFARQSVAEPFERLFVEHRVDAAVHLAFDAEGRDRAAQEATNIQGTRNFLAACDAAGVSTICVVSSALAYGARPTNPYAFYEGAPLDPAAPLPAAADKACIEDLCYDYAKTHPQVCLQILRPAPLVGPRARSFVTRLLDRPLVLAPWGYDPPLQLIHEDDATRAIYRLLKLRKVGVFNLAADGVLHLRRMARVAERRVLRLPVFLLRFLFWLGWRLGIQALAPVHPAYLDYLRYPWLIACVKLKTDGSFMFRHDTGRAFLDYLEARDEPRLATATPPEHDEPEDIDDDELDDDDPVDEAPEPPAAGAPPPDGESAGSAAPAAGHGDPGGAPAR